MDYKLNKDYMAECKDYKEISIDQLTDSYKDPHKSNYEVVYSKYSYLSKKMITLTIFSKKIKFIY